MVNVGTAIAVRVGRSLQSCTTRNWRFGGCHSHLVRQKLSVVVTAIAGFDWSRFQVIEPGLGIALSRSRSTGHERINWQASQARASDAKSV